MLYIILVLNGISPRNKFLYGITRPREFSCLHLLTKSSILSFLLFASCQSCLTQKNFSIRLLPYPISRIISLSFLKWKTLNMEHGLKFSKFIPDLTRAFIISFRQKKARKRSRLESMQKKNCGLPYAYFWGIHLIKEDINVTTYQAKK